MQKMCEHVSLGKIILFLEVHEPNMKYHEFQETFEGKIQHEAISVSMLKSARQLIDREVVADAQSFAAMCVRGYSSEN
jgi:ferritin